MNDFLEIRDLEDEESDDPSWIENRDESEKNFEENVQIEAFGDLSLGQVDADANADAGVDAGPASSDDDESSKKFNIGSNWRITTHDPQRVYIQVAIPESTLTAPRSHYAGFDNPASLRSEASAISLLLKEEERLGLPPEDYTEFDVNDFVIYTSFEGQAAELLPLHHLDTKRGRGVNRTYFDGVLSLGKERFFVKKAPVVALPIGGYGIENRTVDSIWIEPEQRLRRRKVYYRLGCPATEYKRYYAPFLWLADLAKHVVDYLSAMESLDIRVSVHNFKKDFSLWLEKTHGSTIASWVGQHPSSDWRTSVAAHAQFIYKEACGNGMKPSFHALWNEILHFEQYKEHTPTCGNTVVTPYIYRCFQNLPLGNILESVSLNEGVEILRTNLTRNQERRIPFVRTSLSAASRFKESTTPIHHLQLGDTVMVKQKRRPQRGQSSTSNEPSEHRLGLIQRVFKKVSDGERVFDVLWYDQPNDTLCGIMKFPWENEVFLSDECSCAEAWVEQRDIVQSVTIYFGRDPSTTFDLCCRQSYLRSERKWVTLTEAHLTCRHTRRTNASTNTPIIEQPPTTKLRGLDLFCGGGNFGRGLEEGGAVEMRWANDINSRAIHTYMANVDNRRVGPFLGSIDEMQRLALSGHASRGVPIVGEVDFISGGSPCPGFSILTNDKTTSKQRKNQSLVAAFASFVDLYRPKYGILENVRGMIQTTLNDEDVLCQFICALVGLGYQTQLLFLDACSFGSSQHRSRIFVSFAAQGYSIPLKPHATHSFPPKTPSTQYGCLLDGSSMVERKVTEDKTLLKHVSAAKASFGLPAIYDGKPDICIAYPDHRLATSGSSIFRSRINAIPLRPYGLNFSRAWYGYGNSIPRSMLTSDREKFPVLKEGGGISSTAKGSNAYGRQEPHKLTCTVTTVSGPGDAKQGRCLHWEEPRCLSVMEVRRAQGFKDEDVVLGAPTDQYKIVGNSVAREVARALGLSLQQAWLASQHREQPVQDNAIAKTDKRELIDLTNDEGMHYMPCTIGKLNDHLPPMFTHSHKLTSNRQQVTCTANNVTTVFQRKRSLTQTTLAPDGSLTFKKAKTTVTRLASQRQTSNDSRTDNHTVIVIDD